VGLLANMVHFELMNAQINT